MGLRDIEKPALGLLRRLVLEILAPRRQALPDTAGTHRAVRQLEVELVGLRRQLEGARDDLRLLGQPFAASMTMDQAWRRHPRAAEVFARHHLPACDGCAVRFDETLEEAAAAYGLQLSTLLSELDALLAARPETPPPR